MPAIVRPSRLRSAFLAAALLAIAVPALPGLAAAAEPDNVFLVDSSEGYGIDGCVASGAACGQAMADAWCRVHDYGRAVSFGKVKSDATAGAVGIGPVRTAGYAAADTEAVAITCTR